MEDKEIIALYEMRSERAIAETEVKYGNIADRATRGATLLH